MKTQFKPGQTVYLEGGHQARYIGNAEGWHFVERYYNMPGEPFDEDLSAGYPIPVEVVFAEEPVAKLGKECDELNRRIEKRQRRLEEVRTKHLDAERDYCALMERLKSHDALKQIDAFIQGKITHIVRGQYVPEVISIEDYKENGEIPLLTLLGKSNGDLQWSKAQYSDGSGAMSFVRLFCDEENALVYARQMIEASLNDPNWKFHVGLLKAADRYGVAIPEEIQKKNYESTCKNLQKSFLWQHQQLEDSRKVLIENGVPIPEVGEEKENK